MSEVNRKLKPPWVTDPKQKAWYLKRQPDESLQKLLDKKPLPHQKTVPEKKLKNWSKWMSIRNAEHSKISAVTGREPCRILMNTDTCIRSKVEDREVIKIAHIMKVYDDEGTPAVKPNISKYLQRPSLEIEETIKEGVTPTMTYVGVPKLIKIEKGVTCQMDRAGNVCNNFKNSEYKAERELYLKDKIKIIQPHRPRMNQLIVVGHIIPKEKEEEFIPTIPVISITSDENFTEDMSSSPEILVENIVALRINNTIFINEPKGYTASTLRQMMNEKWHEDKYQWRINFTTKPYEKCHKAVKFTNMGTVSISLSWYPSEVVAAFVEQKNFPPVFFFNKNVKVLIPGKSIKMVFSYSSKYPTLMTEKWILVTDPIVSYKEIVFFLDGLTGDEPESANDLEKLQEYVNTRISGLIAKDILNDIVVSLKWDVSNARTTYEDLWDEEFTFNMRNLRYYYHQDVIKKLRDIYSEVVVDQQVEWDLSIRTLRNLILNTELAEQNIHYAELRNCILLILKPKFHLSFVNTNKYMIFYVHLCKFVNCFENESSNLMNIIKSLDLLNMELGIATTSQRESYDDETSVKEMNRRFSISMWALSSKIPNNPSSSFLVTTEKVTYEFLYQKLFYEAIYNLLDSTFEAISASMEQFL